MARPPLHSPVEFHYRKPVRGSLVWWLRCLGVLALVVLLIRLPKSQELRLVHMDLSWLGFCMLLTILQLLLDAFIWHWLLSAQKIRYAYPKTLLALLSSNYLGLITPGHVGEMLAAGYISMDTGITFGYGVSSVVMKKILNWIVVVGFGLWGLGLMAHIPFSKGVEWIVLTSVAVLVILACGIGLWVVSLRQLAKKWQKLSPWQIEMTEFWSGMRHLFSWRLLIPLGIGVVSFTVLFLQMEAVLRALGLHLPFLLVAQIVSFSRLVARIIPISVVGFGSKDAAVIGMLTQHGVDPSVGLTATILLLLCSYLLTLLLSAVSWWIKPLVIRRISRVHD